MYICISFFYNNYNIIVCHFHLEKEKSNWSSDFFYWLRCSSTNKTLIRSGHGGFPVTLNNTSKRQAVLSMRVHKRKVFFIKSVRVHKQGVLHQDREAHNSKNEKIC